MATAFKSPHDRPRLLLESDRLRMAVVGRLDRLVPPIADGGAVCFVVGCGNSGTTLVAARLGNHPAVVLVPEESEVFEPRRSLFAARRRVLGWLDAAGRAGKSRVLEKTPKHLRAIGRIRRLLPEARIVIVVRNPLDTCLSLKIRLGDLGRAIDRWCLDNAEALRRQGAPGTLLVHYEDVTETPEPAFRAMASFLGLPWDEAVLAASAAAYGSVRQKTDTMRLRAAQVAAPIRPNSGKWRTGLEPDEVARVRDRTEALYRALGGSMPA